MGIEKRSFLFFNELGISPGQLSLNNFQKCRSLLDLEISKYPSFDVQMHINHQSQKIEFTYREKSKFIRDCDSAISLAKRNLAKCRAIEAQKWLSN